MPTENSNTNGTPVKMTDRLSAQKYLAVFATTLLYLTASNGTLATELFQGPNTVADDLKPGGEGFADPLTDPKFRAGLFEGEFQPWFDFKDSLKQNYNLDLGLDYTALGQFTNSDLGEGNAASHIARFYGTWTPINPGGVNSGSMNFKIENRLAYTSIAPADLGFDAGAVSVTGYAFSDAGSILTNLYWQQGLLDDRVKIVFGQIDVTDFFDQYPFTSSSTTFLNSAFSGSPAIATPSQGLGAGLGIWLTDQFYALAGIADANADPANPDFLVFDTGETFQSVEFGFTSSRDRIFLDNIHLTLWSVDERKEAGISSDWGASMSASWTYRDSWAPFLRAGYADGGAALYKASVSAGIGHLWPTRDLMGIGINWSRPGGTDQLDDQWTLEAFYRYQVSKHFAVSFDGQLIANPAQDSSQSTIGLFGIRTRVTF